MEINWSKVFDWSVVGVQAPYPLRGANGVFAYCVDVMYRHHGLRRVMFPVTRDRVLVSGQEVAEAHAKQFFARMYAKMQHKTKAR